MSFLLLLVCLAISVHAHADDARPSELKDSQTIIARGILRVAITKFDLPAFHWRDGGGELVGPEIALVRGIGRLLRVGVEFVDDCPTFDSVIDAVASGRADIGVSKLSQTPSRILKVRFSEPYLVLRQALLFDRVTVGGMAEGRPPEDVFRSFAGTIGVIAKSEYVNFAERIFPDAQVTELQSWEDSVEALVSNRVDAVYRDEFEVRRVLQRDPQLNVRFGTAALKDQKSLLSLAICASCVRLQDFINYEIRENRVPFVLTRLLTTKIDK